MKNYLEKQLAKVINDRVTIKIVKDNYNYSLLNDVIFIKEDKARKFLVETFDVPIDEYLENKVRRILDAEVHAIEIKCMRSKFPKEFWELIFDESRGNPKEEFNGMRRRILYRCGRDIY